MQKTFTILTILVLLGGGTFWYTQSKTAPETIEIPTPEKTTLPTQEVSNTPATSTNSSGNEVSNLPNPAFGGYGEENFTMAEVATHNNASSCYAVVNKKVYDLTSFISKHPGGAREILKICGKDGSSYFNKQHGGDAKPEAQLQKQYIGELL